MSHQRKLIKSLVRLALKQGWTVRGGGGGCHYQFRDPAGRFVASVASTPDEGRHSMANMLAALRRGGLKLPPRDGRKS